jgi:UDP-GlcNAc:undecaprenyl-phosphate GlcNAc-1-phosphate transferase
MLASAALAFAVTLGVAPLVLRALRRFQILDRPSARSSHDVPTPRGGGIAPAVGALAGIAAAHGGGSSRIALIVAAGLLGLVGLVDDVRGMGVIPRLLLQFAAGGICLSWLLSGMAGSPAWKVACATAVLVWIAGYVNVFNFMDGINGMSVAQLVVAGVAWYLLGRDADATLFAVGGLAIAAAAMAFAPFNFPNARMFLGDVGSYFLGGWLAILAVIGLRAGIAPEAVAAPLSVYLLDTSATLVSRVRRGEPWHMAHRDHVYQRLVRQGWSHQRTTWVVAMLMAACAGLGAVATTGSSVRRVGADIAIGALLIAYLRAPAWIGRPRLASSPAGA